jgi:hypothetical protein
MGEYADIEIEKEQRAYASSDAKREKAKRKRKRRSQSERDRMGNALTALMVDSDSFTEALAEAMDNTPAADLFTAFEKAMKQAPEFRKIIERTAAIMREEATRNVDGGAVK